MALRDETTEIRAGHEIDRARLLEYLTARVPGIGADASVRQFRGGQSNPTFLVESSGRAFVLRKKPPLKRAPRGRSGRGRPGCRTCRRHYSEG